MPMDWKQALKSVKKALTSKAQMSLNLTQAVRDKNIARATQLIADGAKPDNKAYRSDNALMIAVESGSLDMVKLLLGAGADPNVGPRYSSTTPLLVAAREGF